MIDEELQVRIELVPDSDRQEAVKTFVDFETYEETHLIGGADLVAYLKPANDALANLLGFIKNRKENQIVGRLTVHAGPDRSVEIERFQIESAKDIEALARRILDRLDDDKET